MLIAGCNSVEMQKDNYTYSSLNRFDLSINLNKMIYEIGHELSLIKDCSSAEFPFCLTFDSTIILIPDFNLIDDFEDGFHEGIYEDLNIKYVIHKVEANVLDEIIDGYLFNAEQISEITKQELIQEQLKGAYFYSPNKGVVLFEHNYIVRSFTDYKPEVKTETFWSNSRCGLFHGSCE